MSCRQPVSRAAAKRVGTNIAILQKSCPMPLSLLTLSKLLLSVRQDSSPAADVHAGLFVLGYGWASRGGGGPPAGRPPPPRAFSCSDRAGPAGRGAGPEGPAQTWRSAPQIAQHSSYRSEESPLELRSPCNL